MPNNRPPISAPDSSRSDFGEEPISGVLPPIAIQVVEVSGPQPTDTSPQSSSPESQQSDTTTK